MLSTGTRVGPYEVLAGIGAGGMGEVYRARDSRLGRDVALKVLPESFATDAERLRRFQYEAKVVASISHPNIIPIHDVGKHNGAPYLVMELLEGETLRDRLRAGALPARRCAELAVQIAKGLAAAHDKGVAHRDLKPENIFLTRDGQVKILDFGLAKLTRAEAAAAGGDAHTLSDAADTAPGTVLGTIGYMSPEQVRGQVTDHRSDIFTFGAILYEMLAGQRAFKGETTADTMSSILKDDPPDLTTTGKQVPPAFERIVRHCLEKSPEMRFQSARDIAFGLEELSGVSATTTEVASAAHVRSRRRLGSAAIIAAAVVGAFAAGILLARRGPAELPTYHRMTFGVGSIGGARFTPDGNIVYDARWVNGPSEVYLSSANNPDPRPLGFSDAEVLAVSAKGELALKLHSWRYNGAAVLGTLARAPVGGGSPRPLVENVNSAAWAPNGEDIAVTRFVPETQRWRIEYPLGKVLWESENWANNVAVSRDGKSVAFADHGNAVGDDRGAVAVIGPDGKEKVLSSGWETIAGICWAPAGDEVWFAAALEGADRGLFAVSLHGKLRALSHQPVQARLLDVNGGTALIVAERQRLGIRGVRAGDKQERELGWMSWSLPTALSADGREILFEDESEAGGANYSVYLRATDGSPPVRLAAGVALALSPDGKWALTRLPDDPNLRLVPTGAGETRIITHDKIQYTSAAFLPDGKHVVASGIERGHATRDYLVDVGTGDSKPITPDGISGTDVSPDGKQIAVTGTDGSWQLWDIAAAHATPVRGLAAEEKLYSWTADGKSLFIAPRKAGPGGVRDVFLLDIATGKRKPWTRLTAEGVLGLQATDEFIPAKDPRNYIYLYVQNLGEAYLVKGLK